MADFSSQFLDFLKAYDSGAYADATSMAPDDPKAAEALEARKNQIYSTYKDKEALWESIPQAIRDRYPGRPLPQDIMDAAARGEIDTLRAMEYNASLKTAEEAREKVREAREEAKKWTDITTEAAFNVAVTAAVAGYAMETCHELARNRQLRDALHEKTGGKMSPEEKAAWLESRRRDRDAIKHDFFFNQPERALVHLLSLHSRGRIDDETFARDIAEVSKRLETGNRQEHLLHYLKLKPIQAKLSRLNPEDLEVLRKNITPYIPESERGKIMENIESRAAARAKRIQNVNEKPDELVRQKVHKRDYQNQNVRSL